MKNLKYILTCLFATIFIMGCQDEDYEVGDLVAPTNIQIQMEFVGADANNPNGDGSGSVNFVATADNAITIQYLINGERIVANSNGEASYRFTEVGLNTYEVTVVAYGTGGSASSETVLIDVLSLFEPPAILSEAIVGKTFRIKAEVGKHFGLGPVGGGTLAEWYGASPLEKDGLGMYDDRYTFNADGTYTHVTNGDVFGREVLINELGGSGGTQNGADIENYSYNDYQGTWSFVPLDEDKVGIRLSGTSFIGYYIGGSHTYEIFKWDDPEFTVKPPDFALRSTDGNNEFDWWFIITPVE